MVTLLLAMQDATSGALAAASAAAAAEQRGDPAAALELYTAAIEALLAAKKAERSAERKQRLKGAMIQCLERAEGIKRGAAAAGDAGGGGLMSGLRSTFAGAFGGGGADEPLGRSASAADAVAAVAAATPAASASRAPRAAPLAAAAPRRAAAPARRSPGGGGGRAAAPAALARPTDASKALDQIRGDIVDASSIALRFADISGLEAVKELLRESVILPALRPDIFTGLRAPPKGILLYGPPGNGKTLLAKAVAAEAGATFFAISASSLTGSLVGESEKAVRALFQEARARRPAFIFIDEVDSILTSRSEGESESSRRLKTELLIQFDGVQSGDNSGGVIVMGATNRPQELDEAARRRFTKRILIPLPDPAAREGIIRTLISKNKHSIKDAQFAELGAATEGYSGADLHGVCQAAAMRPVRELSDIAAAKTSAIRKIAKDDVTAALRSTRPSVDQEQLRQLQQWDNQFGSS